MLDILLWAVGIVFFASIYSLSRWVHPYLGVVGPVAWSAGVIFVACTGQMLHFRDFMMAAIGFLVTLTVWGGGVTARKNIQTKESDRLDNSLH